MFSPKIENKIKCTLIPSFQHLLTASAENKKAIQIGNEVKLSPFRDGVIFYVENPKELRSLLKLISKVSKVARLKVNNWILNFFF